MLTTLLTAIAAMLAQSVPASDDCENIDWLDFSSSAPGFKCEEITQAEEVYLALMVGTVAGEPFPYVMLLKSPEQGWRLSAYGYDAEPVEEGDDFSWTVSRHGFETTLSRESVAPFLQAVDSGAYDGIPDVPLYPVSEEGDVICLDGSTLNVITTGAGISKGKRHSCAGRTLLDEFAEALAALAIEADPVMERYLDVLSQDQD